MSSKVNNGIAGYKYYLGMHKGICHGPVDELLEIRAGDKVAWSGNAAPGTSISINEPELFGGEEKEGGIVGTVDLEGGESTQGVNDYLQSKIGGIVPAFRGIFALVLRQVYITANNPYIKPWSIKLRATSHANWYPEKSNISGDMNPAHIIFSAITNTAWGLGYSPTQIDQVNFAAVADTLYTEGFGLSFKWNKQEEVWDFIERVCDHINARVTEDPSTGKFVIKRRLYRPCKRRQREYRRRAEHRQYARAGRYFEQDHRLSWHYQSDTRGESGRA